MLEELRAQSKKTWMLFFCALGVVFVIDQGIKWYFVLEGYQQGDLIYETPVISLLFVYNKGVAFSLFAFLQEWLKYLQILLLVLVFVYLCKQREILREYAFAIGVIFGAGISNILDRFIHQGVVDYIFWHYQFEFAIFNFADVMINCGVAIILITILLKKKRT